MRAIARFTLITILFALAGAGPLSAQSTVREAVDLSRLRVARDSFVVMLQGKPRGFQRLTVARTATGWQFGDAVTVDSMVSQSSVADFDQRLQEISLTQAGDMTGRRMAINLRFADGRVRGRSMTPVSGPTGAIEIDTVIADGIPDDNAVLPMMAAIRWREGLSFTAPVLSSGRGTITEYSFRVVGTESVTVPAGLFQTWRVEQRAQRSVTFVNVTTTPPYRIVRVSNGPVFEMLLVK
ncbi:MAG: DUF3108 domain-containing protein [Gemmatimonadaceae bacterium]|nr:DUF3108 domain-containing protein [Gemmatimonadaceae bacterium]